MTKRILVKVGTHILGRENGRLDYNRISDIVDQIVAVREQTQVILVSSGATRAGKEFRQFHEVKDPLVRKQMLASIGQGRLFQVYSDFFREKSVVTAQALLTSGNFRWESSFQNMKTALEGLIDNKVLPIINENDVTSFRESSFGDNDQLAALTSAMMNVDMMIMLSDIVGFFTADPKIDSSAKLVPHVRRITPELLQLCEDSLSDGGTGGMLSKLKAAEFATEHGIPTVVCSGTEKNCIVNAVNGSTTGTLFDSSKKIKKFSPHGNWMITGADIKGSITIDAGAQKALKNNNSLLAVGIISVEGPFAKKEVVLIQNEEKIRLGTGLANFESSEIKGFVQSLEKPKGVVVVHKNHLFML